MTLEDLEKRILEFKATLSPNEKRLYVVEKLRLMCRRYGIKFNGAPA